ncbi:hypothetical protein WJX72_003979 [[Myrmecia] bisecta]|uniref:Coproporphyrinogen oxidase n=1 Tax=[Myrmecia] bisecta TaxID=41462 RepID=A0AAW1PTG3_9CHLO
MWSSKLYSISAVPGASNQQAIDSLNQQSFEAFLLQTQQGIIQAAEGLDGSGRHFQHDRWQRNPEDPNAGYGITCVLEGGDLLEKAAVNISMVKGTLSAERAKAMSSRGREIGNLGGQAYTAAALSLVFHSAHPMVPTLRADVRLFQVGASAWFGGGCDLTPSYLFEEDAREFHAHWKRVCDAHGPQLYPECKAWCDRYFYLPARREHRGIGGIFFDDLQAQGPLDAEGFVRSVATNIIPSWEPSVARRRSMAYTPAQRNWQLLRRGRYLEFNLLYDRGVRFGLEGGRIESIMVSAPPLIAWRYNVVPEEGSPEAELMQVLRKPREWG